MTDKDIGDALELLNEGISLLELADFYEVDAIALNTVFKEITTFKILHHKCNTMVEVRQSKINITDTSDIIDYQ